VSNYRNRAPCWLLALEDAIDIAGRASVHIDGISPVGDQVRAFDAPINSAVERIGNILPIVRDYSRASVSRERSVRRQHS
jgi:hypothetical protein